MTGDSSRFAEVASRLGRRLCRDAIWSGRRCNWLGFAPVRSERGWGFQYRALDPTLAEGTAGIAVFLARLAQVDGDPVVRETAEAAAERVRAAVAERDLPVGFHEGRAGVCWALTETGRLLQREDLVEAGVTELINLAGEASTEETCGIGRGVAGVALALLSTAAMLRREDLLPHGFEIGQLLAERARRSDRGCTWPTGNRFGITGLLGYAHGPSGIASVLLRLERAGGPAGMAAVAWQAFDFERAFFDPSHRTWPEREPDGASSASRPQLPAAWCHGAAGIGIARLLATTHRRVPEPVAADTEAAIGLCRAAAEDSLRPGDASPCHGSTGSAEMLLLASNRLRRPELRRVALGVADHLIEQHHRNDLPWPCGLPSPGEIPSLLLGLAGIGDFYLRLARPEVGPSLLTLEA